MPGKINFKNIPENSPKILEITSFAGIDLSSAPADIDKKRSPDAPNMMPDSKGNPIKRTGFSLFKKCEGRINGAFVFGKHLVIHAGKNLFIDGKKVWEGMADSISTGQIVGSRLYIFDGFEALVCDGTDVWPLCDDAYIPTVLISKNADEFEKETVLEGNGTDKSFVLEEVPERIVSVMSGNDEKEAVVSENKIIFETAPEEGEKITVRAIYAREPGGTKKEEFNLISSRWKESFLCSTGTEKNFSLSKKNLSAGKVRAWIMNENGEMEEKAEGTDFSVDRENGKIVFNEAISKAPITGEDNLVIEAEKDFDGYENRINKCMRSVTFDTGGASTRIFLCGNPDEPGKDFWCAAGDPTYWPDIYYSELCGEGSEILGYSIIENAIGAYISNPRDGRSIIIRTSVIDDEGNVSFPIEKHLQGEAAVCPNGFAFIDKEQLFLTNRGVYAITTEDISGEKYTQNRSYFINKVLCGEKLDEAFCIKWKQFFVIAVGGKLWLLDTSQRSYQRGEPLSNFQYECYLWTGISARVLWEKDGGLFFGDEKGNICRFIEDRETAVSYEDHCGGESRPIEAYWTVPDFAGETFWKNKNIRTVALELAPYAQNKVRLEYKTGGKWNVLKEWTDKISYFAWSSVNWANFKWNGNVMPRTVTLKTKIRKFDKAGFRIVCDEIDRAFGLYGFSLEYTESGRFKK